MLKFVHYMYRYSDQVSILLPGTEPTIYNGNNATTVIRQNAQKERRDSSKPQYPSTFLVTPFALHIIINNSTLIYTFIAIISAI